MSQEISSKVKERIELLSQEMNSIITELNLKPEGGLGLASYTSDGIKRMSSAFCFDEKLVHKIKNAVRLGYLKNVISLEPALWEFINKVERDNGPIPTTPGTERLGAKWSQTRKTFTPAELLIRQINRQITKLKEECSK